MQGCKKVVSIQDISGLGRCSLTVVIPVLSAMGIQVCPVPTAVLSAHTGYSEFVMRDLTDFMKPALEHYKKMDMKFDCVYSGFLASSEQIDHCLEFFEAFPDALKVVDPVMGDGGKAYKTYTKELKSWLVRLSKQGAKIVVITSVNLADGGMSTVGYDKENNSFWKIKNDYVPAHYSGTGDMFTSVLIGGLLKGDSLPIAMNRATAFTELTVKTTYSYQTPWTDGLMLEGQLPWLTSYQELRDYTNL